MIHWIILPDTNRGKKLLGFIGQKQIVLGTELAYKGYTDKSNESKKW